MSSELDELLGTLNSSLKELREERKAHTQSLKEKGNSGTDLTAVRLMNLESQILKQISKIRQQIEAKKSPEPISKDDSFLKNISPTALKKIEKILMNEIEKEMESGPIPEKGTDDDSGMLPEMGLNELEEELNEEAESEGSKED